MKKTSLLTICLAPVAAFAHVGHHSEAATSLQGTLQHLLSSPDHLLLPAALLCTVVYGVRRLAR